MPRPATSDTCQTCGKTIPALPVSDAYCVACRYHQSPKAKSDQGPSEYDIALETSSADEPRLTARDRIEDVLLNAGVPLAQLGHIADDLEQVLSDVAFQRAAELFRSVLRKLDGLAAGAALERALLGSDFESLADAATRLGCSKIAVHKQEHRVRQRLTGLTAGPLVEQ